MELPGRSVELQISFGRIFSLVAVHNETVICGEWGLFTGLLLLICFCAIKYFMRRNDGKYEPQKAALLGRH